jgi:YfiH family protein
MPRTSRLLDLEGVSHAFGTAADGDFRSAPPPVGIAIAHQVHGNAVFQPSGPGRSSAEADALLARPPLGVGILTADCVPILLADSVAGIAAAVHAGWRGTLSGVVKHAVGALVREGADANRLRVAIGPCIRACCYEVSEDLLAAFVHEFGEKVRRHGTRLDLALANREHLTWIGIPAGNVDDLDECTHCAQSGDTHRYFSHRRSGEPAGRQLSWVRAARPLS